VDVDLEQAISVLMRFAAESACGPGVRRLLLVIRLAGNRV
jgi:hypothetical protein